MKNFDLIKLNMYVIIYNKYLDEQITKKNTYLSFK